MRERKGSRREERIGETRMKRRRAAVSRPWKEWGLLAAAVLLLTLAAIWGTRRMHDTMMARIFALWFLAAFGAALLAAELLGRAPQAGDTPHGGEARRESNPQELLGALSHDLRTPVTSVIGLTELALEAAQQGEAVDDQLRQILTAAQAMKLIMDDLIDVSDTAECVRFRAEDLVRELTVLVKPRARDKDQRLTIDLSALYGRQFDADYAGLSRILLNLLTNSVKYTQKGGEIRLDAHIEYQQGDSVQAVFVVRDNGMGMKPEFMKRMYEPYARARETAHIPGTGLGLNIVRQLVERMSGTIEVQSEWKRGTAFSVSVPLKAACAGEDAQAAFSFAGRRFLLAEDNALAAQIVTRLLLREQAEVCWARDGGEAVRMFRQSPQGSFDAVLMDMRMPGMDGCQAARAIRRAEAPGSRPVPILAMTASVDAHDVRRALDAGMNAYIAKPVEIGRLCAALADVMKQ